MIFGRKQKNNGKTTETKTISISSDDLASLQFFARCAKEREQEMFFWRAQAEAQQKDILKRNALSNGWIPEWRNVLQTGKLVVTKAPEPVVVPGNGEEKKK